MVERLDQGLKNFARVVERHNGKDISSLAGAGAAGGMGGGFVALLNARLVPGIEMVLDAIRFDQIIAQSELVITGEGRLDRQTVMGKAPSGVLRAAQRRAIPCIAIGGAIAMCEELEQSGFAALLPIVSGPIALQEAMREDVAEQNVRRTAEQLARIVNIKTQTK
jgi:glycerate kinase